MSSTLEIKQTPDAWYKIGMVWIAIGLPAIVVLASLVTVVIAHKNAPSIVPTKIVPTKIAPTEIAPTEIAPTEIGAQARP